MKEVSRTEAKLISLQFYRRTFIADYGLAEYKRRLKELRAQVNKEKEEMGE